MSSKPFVDALRFGQSRRAARAFLARQQPRPEGIKIGVVNARPAPRRRVSSIVVEPTPVDPWSARWPSRRRSDGGVLAAAGVKRVYGVVGDSLNGITDADNAWRGGIEWLHVRHEEVAAFAAEKPTPTLPATSRSAPEVAAPATCTLCSSLSCHDAHAFRWWRSQRKFPRRRSARTISRNTSRSPVPGMLQLLRARVESPSRCRACSRSRLRRSGALRQRPGRSRRCGAGSPPFSLRRSWRVEDRLIQ